MSLPFNINISNFYRWDLKLKNDHSTFFKCCDDYSYEDLISSISFSSGELISSVNWDEAIANVSELCDFNLTGYDNGFLYNLSSETVSLTNNKFIVYPVSGLTYCYDYSIINSGITYTNLNGGFFQGFYKLHDYDYQVLPNTYPQGVTFEIVFRKTNNASECDKPLLNSLNVNNNNFIFYIGTRAVNKFCNINENEIGLLTCDGSESLFDEYEVSQRKIFENAFLYYNEKNVCEFSGHNYDVALPNCCDDIIDNAWGIRFTADNGLNLRVITTTGECVDNSWVDTIVINNYYSEPNVFEDNQWYQLAIRFEPTSYNECNDYNYGDLSVFLNGKRKLYIKDIKEIKSKPLSTSKNKQLGVPYNISVGGGVQGLLESVDVIAKDDNYFSGDSLCNYYLKVKDCYSIKGAIINGVEFLSENLIQYDDLEAIRLFLLSIMPQRYGNIEVEQRGMTGYLETYITIFYSKDVIDSLILTDGVYKEPYDIRCFDIPEHNLDCLLLEDNFAGTFIGDIHSFNIYNKALPIQEIECYLKNYNFI